jgi:pyruvate,water dikinase
VTHPPRLAARLDGSGIGPVEAGGKGAALDRIVALGAPVPRCGVLTSAAYRSFAGVGPVADLVARLRDAPVPPPEEHERARAEVDAAFLAAPMPAEVLDAVRRLVGDVGRGGPVAVRSSATAEDMRHASFAGQYRSFLGVDGAAAEDAVRLTWASLWHPAPRLYRRFRGTDEDGLAMAVVVMRMLAPSRAGVLFTTDPEDPAMLRIEFVEGLGDALVSGAVTPGVVRLHRRDGAGADGTGCGERPELPPDCAALADLVVLSRRLEDALGAPQDLEWAVERGHLWVLQARPITTLPVDVGDDDGFDAHLGGVTATTAGIAEMLPGVVPPRLWELNRWLLEEAFRRLFASLGGTVPGCDPAGALLGRYRGRAAVNLDGLRAATASIPGGSPEELEQQYFGDVVAADRPSGSTAAATGFRQGYRTLHARADAALESEIVIRAVDALAASPAALEDLSDEKLQALSARVRHLGARAMAAEVAVAALAAACFRGVEMFLERRLGDGGATAAQRVTGGTAVRRTSIAIALEPIADELRREPRLRLLVTELDRDGARAALAADHDGAPLLDRLDAAMTMAGSMATFAGPTWDEAPDLAWATLRHLCERPRPTRPPESTRRDHRAEVEAVLGRDPHWRLTRILTGQVVDVRRAFLRREADDAAEFLDRRERTKAAVLVLGGLARRIDLELADRLVARGRLEAREDVVLVTVRELAALLGGAGPTLEAIALRRRRLDAAMLDGPLPRVFHGEPSPVRHPVVGTAFPGWAASPGVHEGIARVVRSATAGALRRGEVLVANTTDASWTPLFLAAGAIVVEEGGPLSHAAIVARELGIPAVVNVPGIVDRLERELGPVAVTVDGTAGVVRLHPPHATRSGGAIDGDGEAGGRTGPLGTLVPTRRPAARIDEPTVPSLNVFVAGLVGAGAVLSAVVPLTDAISSARGRARLARRAAPVAAMLADGVQGGFDAVADSPTGLRPRRWYGTVAAVLAVLAAAVGTRATLAAAGIGPRTDDSLLVWALIMVSVADVAGAAVVLGLAARRWPSVPLVVRRTLPVRPRAGPPASEVLGRARTRLVAALLGAVAVLGVATVAARATLDRLDRALYDAIGAGAHADRWGPEWENYLGRRSVVLVVALAIAVVTWRCRCFALVFPLAIVTGGVATRILSWLTSRPRPARAAHVGAFTSFPGGHVVQVTLLFGLVPLAVWIVTRRRVMVRVARVVCGLALVLQLSDTVRTGGHWPSDQLAGFLLAASLVIAVHAVVAEPTSHVACSSCPAVLGRAEAAEEVPVDR